MNKSQFLQQNDEDILATARALHVAYGLKKTLRYATTRDFSVHSESVAEHVYALLFLAQYFLLLEDTDGHLDPVKVYQIILFHDFGEMGPDGDIPYHLKTAEHEQNERIAAKEIFLRLLTEVQELARSSWADYDSRQSPEADFVYALDKIEPLFELLDPINEVSVRRLKFTYEMHIQKKLKATERFPVMRRFVEVMTDSMVNRNVFSEEG